MLTLPNVTTQDNYVAATTLGPVATCQQIRYVVANKPVLAQIMPKGADLSERSWGDPLLITPESNVITRCQGMRFKSAVAGVPAQVIAQLIEPADPVPTSGNPFTGTLSAGGGVSPGVSSVQIQSDGVLIGTEPILDFADGLGALPGALWRLTDDAAGTRIIAQLLGFPLVDVVAGDALPAGVNGLTVAYYPDKTNFPEALWIMRYLTATARWHWAGGSELFQFDASGSFRQNSIASTWQNTPGLSVVTLARGGKYRVTYGTGSILATNANDVMQLGVSANGATPPRPWLFRSEPATVGFVGQSDEPGGEMTIDVTIAAGQTIAQQMFTAAPADQANVGPTIGIRPVYFT